MNYSEIILWILITIISIFSYFGFKDNSFFEKYKLNINSIVNRKEYYRIISSSFLHADFIHLFFNLYTLYMFGRLIIYYSNPGLFLIIYFISVISGSLLAIFCNRNNGYYSAIGASAGVTGITFAAIVLQPQMNLSILLPIFSLPAWIFAILYLFYSIYGIKNSFSNIGHEAHIGGAISGIITILCIFPILAISHFFYIIAVMIPIIYFIYLVFKNK